MPQEQIYNGNYIGKSLAGIGLSQEFDTSYSGNGIYTEAILGAADKYMIDLYGSIMTFRPKDTPLLTIMDSLGTESANGPYYIWSDEYKGDSWWDISLDTLRKRNSASSHSAMTLPDSGYGAGIPANVIPLGFGENTYSGGALMVQPITEIGTTTANILKCTAADSDPTASPAVYSPITAMTVISNNYLAGQAFVPTNGDANVVLFALKNETTNIGNTDVVWNKIRVLLANLGYTERVYVEKKSTAQDPQTNVSGRLLRYSLGTATARVPVYMSFPNISVHEGGAIGTKYNYTQVIARLEAVWYGNVANSGVEGADTGEYLIFAVNFSQSNETFTLGAYATGGSPNYDSVMLAHPFKVGNPANGTAVFGATANAAAQYAGTISRMLFIGESADAPLPVPEGDKFTQTGNFTTGREKYMNNCQIFVSPAYGVTGTHQASTFRFGDDFQTTRDMNLRIYKSRMQAAFMYGIKFETLATHSTNGFVRGQMVRATSGLMDYAMFPIRHIKKPLVASGWNTSNIAAFITWLDELGDAVVAGQQGDKKDATFMVSQKFINRINVHVRTMLGNLSNGNNPYLGGMITQQKPSQISFGLEYYEYKTTSGVTLRFIHDPAQDNTPSIRVPYWIYGTDTLSPRDLLFAIDPRSMKRKVLRPDKIYGNIQDPGQDAFLEGMRGESGFMLRFPQNHTIVYAPQA